MTRQFDVNQSFRLFQAYELWKRENGEEVPLAGIDLDYRQIFYVSFAQVIIQNRFFCYTFQVSVFKWHKQIFKKQLTIDLQYVYI